ncbi:TraM recognition domain-containing protein [Pontibacter qinzhouensis]|uniref:TraM recognition domain-containing protein n=1 Tax=Pontibacter qinzhouensis TaxID=2603253 RepID=A0A5C8K7W6_9BACT|nr:conjugal transfer protein MobC [Pontibacter qinzhouensis]TXK45725.1 TraM recognition domain-containing protein [Pontibacter qinzhouensis]
MNTGENTQALRQIIDFTRLLSLVILLLHFYIACHAAFAAWELTAPVVDRMLLHTQRLPLFQGLLMPKAAALLLLCISLLGAKGKKDEHIKQSTILSYLLLGLLLYWVSTVFLLTTFAEATLAAPFYIGTTAIGYLLILAGGTLLSRLIKLQLDGDIFNRLNESFPQEERLLENEYSINLPARYQLRGRTRSSWINVVNPFRALLVIGTPGAGKSYFVIRHVITQHIRKGFALFLYDFKYDDLTRIAYNTLLRHQDKYPVKPSFYVINFDDLSRTHRCNPLDPDTMNDITDATEASRTIMLGLNREWIKKQGDFFVESPINFVTAIIWFLKKYRGGRYCTLPHVIELMEAPYGQLFSLLRTEPEIEVLINPFVSAFEQEAVDQLEGQIASAKISMARLVSPQLYYVLSGNDFTLDLNNPQAPKLVCLGNNPLKQQVYGAVLSLYVSRTIKLVNQKGRLKSSLVFDEFPTIYFNGIDSLIATARSNRVATTLGVQDYSQLKKDYGREQAEVVMNIVGNVISGQVTGETAKQLSERFGKILQQRESVSINSSDTSVSRSTQLDAAVPPATIASLSSGEFVGMVADDPQCRIALKAFHAEILNDHKAIAREEQAYVPVPLIREVDATAIHENYVRIKQEVQLVLASTPSPG